MGSKGRGEGFTRPEKWLLGVYETEVYCFLVLSLLFAIEVPLPQKIKLHGEGADNPFPSIDNCGFEPFCSNGTKLLKDKLCSIF